MELSSDAGIRQGATWPEVFRIAPLAALLATCAGVGLLPGAPGTWGSLVAVGLTLLANHLAGIWGVLGLALVAGLGGIWASQRVAELRKVKDPSEVVADEVAGQALALLGVLASGATGRYLGAGILAAFLLFRFLDILKPGPIGRIEALPGGIGIMCDDVVAGVLLGGLLFAVLSLLT